MRQWFQYLFAVVAVIGWSTASTAPLGHEFSLDINHVATIEGTNLVIKFKAVVEDSRCPVNAVCTWAGNGQTELEVLDIDGQQKMVILNTSDDPKAVILKAHKLNLIALRPPRVDGMSIPLDEYSVTLRVERKAPD